MIRILIILAAFRFLSGCTSRPANSDDFVLISIFTACRNESEKLADPVDKNVYFIQASDIYSEFIKRGVSPENIYVLYKDGKPDFNEPMLKARKEIRAEFSGKYSNLATVPNFKEIEQLITSKMTAESRFHLIIDGHGFVKDGKFKIHSEQDDKYLGEEDFRTILSDNTGIHHLYFGSCHSGSLLKSDFGVEGLIVTTCPAGKSCWLDRSGYFAKYYFKNMPVNLGSKNEYFIKSFKQASKEYSTFGLQRLDFIRLRYGSEGLSGVDGLSWETSIKEL